MRRMRSFYVLAGTGVGLLLLTVLGATIFAPRWLARRQLAVAVDGIIEQKAIVSHRQKNISGLRHVLFIRQKSGEVVRLPVPFGIYEQARLGMPVHKTAGEPWPSLGSSAEP